MIKLISEDEFAILEQSIEFNEPDPDIFYEEWENICGDIDDYFEEVYEKNQQEGFHMYDNRTSGKYTSFSLTRKEIYNSSHLIFVHSLINENYKEWTIYVNLFDENDESEKNIIEGDIMINKHGIYAKNNGFNYTEFLC
jgi:hypothetical protein